MYIPFYDYVRAFRVIKTVLQSYEGTNAHKACIPFAVAGMRVLREHYQKEATVSLGRAAYVLGSRPDGGLDVLGYGFRSEGEVLTDDPNAFHCWVQVDGWAIDFMAPLFPEVWRREHGYTAGAPRMFQRRLDEMTHCAEFDRPGDFFLEGRDQDSSLAILSPYFTRPAYQDMFNTVVQWFRPGSQKMRNSITLFDQKSNGPIDLRLDTKLLVQGSW